MSQKFAAVKGMNDLLPGRIEIWQYIEEAARTVLGRFGYSEIRTPMLEDTALFVRSVGEETDIVGKEMYTFEDKGGRSLSLRPEGTAPSVRSYIENTVWNHEPVTRWFYMGPMFRYERMKTGRYRQFSQIGAEAFGVKEPAQDVEIMEMVARFLEKIELPGVRLHINSLGDDQCRPAYTAKLVAYFQSHREALCGDCQRRLDTNPLRILDCKNPECQKIARGAPQSIQSLCAPCAEHFDRVKAQLEALGIRYEVDPWIVRGLDYYTRTAFEFIADHPVLGTASTVGGGGRYDKLVQMLGGPEIPAVGFGLGLDRLSLLLAESGRTFTRTPKLFIAMADEAGTKAGHPLVSRLRQNGVWVDLDVRGGSLKSQMKRADKVGAEWVVVLGEQEVSSGWVTLKPMRGGEPRKVELFSLLSALQS